MDALYVVALLLVVVTMALSLAHALEFPGKLRLDEPTYRAVQAIYYPGFTIGGLVGEFGALVTLPVLLAVTSAGSPRFWGTAVAFGLLLLGHGIYWLVTHPVNRAWLKETEVSRLGGVFFGAGSGRDGDWRRIRSYWEYSHIARAVLATCAFLSMTVALLG